MYTLRGTRRWEYIRRTWQWERAANRHMHTQFTGIPVDMRRATTIIMAYIYFASVDRPSRGCMQEQERGDARRENARATSTWRGGGSKHKLRNAGSQRRGFRARGNGTTTISYTVYSKAWAHTRMSKNRTTKAASQAINI